MLTENDIFENQLTIARTMAQTTNTAQKAELQKQLEFYEVERARIISANNAERIALLQPRITRLEEIILIIGDPHLMIRVGEFRKQAEVPPPNVVSPPIPVPLPDPIVTPVPVPTPTPVPAPVTAIDPTKRDRDLKKLHPLVRKKAQAIQKKLDDEGIPLRVFEAYREPERQAHLYAKGRTTSGSKVTNAKAWQSYHQYGLAADFVRFENGNWNWNTSTAKEKKQWKRFHEIARDKGLEPLSWELPHVQLIGTSFAKLLNGEYPDDSDETWNTNMAKAINRWSGSDKPPLPESDERPPMPSPPTDPTDIAPVTSSDWHSKFGGDSWRYDDKGVYTRHADGSLKLWRSAGSPITAQEIWANFKDEISASSQKYKVPPALIMMTIATETGRFRLQGFTGPKTFRWEQHYVLNATGDPDLDGKERGDYSAGPMQVLSDTARWMNNTHDLGYSNSSTLKHFKNKPTKAPTLLGLYDPATCIDIGSAYIAHNAKKTGYDPILVAACYNAGSLRASPDNHWRIHSHGNHLDRAAEWFGDALLVLS